MRGIIPLLLLLTASPAIAQARNAADEVHAEILSMESAAAKLDADEFMRSYWQSPALTITFDGETMRGWETILNEQRKWWSDKSAGIKFSEQRPPEIVQQGDGVVTSVQWMAITSVRDKAPSRLVITSVWKKLPQGWRIVLAHESLVH